jgi:hypothetical protein
MYASIRVTSWSAAWYFISFIILCTLLIGNLFRAYFLSHHLSDD